MNLHMCAKFGANRSSRLTESTYFWMCDSLNPKNAPWDIEGRIVFNLCPFPDESVALYQIWWQSVQPFDSFPDFWMFDPLNPRNAPLCLEAQFVWHISIPRLICICVPNLVSIGSFSRIYAKLVWLLATGRAVSRKNTPKNNIYTSKMVIPARTCRHQRHWLSSQQFS